MKFLILTLMILLNNHSALASDRKCDLKNVKASYTVSHIDKGWAMIEEIALGDLVMIENESLRIIDRKTGANKYEKKLVTNTCHGRDCIPSFFDCWRNSQAKGISYEEIPYQYELRVISIYQNTGESDYGLSDCQRWDTGGSGCQLQLKLVRIKSGQY